MFRVHCGLGIVCLMLAGCGASTERLPLTEVTGIVTLDGQPLPQANVVYLPVTTGQPSFGVTDETGSYTLKYADSSPGAVRGTHRVEIRTGGEKLDANGNIVSETPERLPPRYHLETRLIAEVGETPLQKDFELTSK